MTSQHVLYYCTYYSVSLTCTVHCTYCIPSFSCLSDVEASSSTSVHIHLRTSRRDQDGGRGGRGGREGRGNVHFARDAGTPCLTSSITHLTCNCGGADVNSTYRQCLVSMHNSTTYFTALTLFDTGAYISFVNREVAKWLELQQHGGTVAGAHLVRSSRHDVPTSEIGLAGTQMSSSIYGTTLFDLTLFNEVTKSDNILKKH